MKLSWKKRHLSDKWWQSQGLVIQFICYLIRIIRLNGIIISFISQSYVNNLPFGFAQFNNNYNEDKDIMSNMSAQKYIAKFF